MNKHPERLKGCVRTAMLFLAALPDDILPPDEGRVDGNTFVFHWLNDIDEAVFTLNLNDDNGWFYYFYNPDGSTALRVGEVQVPLHPTLVEDLWLWARRRHVTECHRISKRVGDPQ